MSPSDSQPPSSVLALAPTYRYVGVSLPERIHTSPCSPAGSGLPSWSAIITSPLLGRPTEPRCASHSVPVMMVAI